VSFHLPTSCVSYPVAQMFCCAKSCEGKELYEVSERDGSVDFHYYRVAKVELHNCGSRVDGTLITYESTEGRPRGFSELATRMLRGVSRDLTLSFFFDELNFSRAPALAIFENALSEGRLRSWIIDNRGKITPIQNTFYMIRGNFWLYRSVAIARLADRTIRGEVFVRRDELEGLYRRSGAVTSNTSNSRLSAPPRSLHRRSGGSLLQTPASPQHARETRKGPRQADLGATASVRNSGS
jgi:hypothetical protein